MADKKEELLFAKVAGRYNDGVSLLFPGETEPTRKHYKIAGAAAAIKVGDTVNVSKLSGTFVVEYVVMTPGQAFYINKCPDSPTPEQCANWINAIVNALDAVRVVRKNW